MTGTTSRILLVVAALAAALALAGCSGGSSGDEAAGEQPAEENGAPDAATAPEGEAESEDGALGVGLLFAGADTAGAADELSSAFEGRIEAITRENAASDPAGAAAAVVSEGAGLVLSEVPGACAAVPDVPCVEPAGAAETSPEAVTLDTAFADRAYLLGLAAGHLTESDQVGYVAAGDSPLETAAVNAFTLGCQEANTNCQVRLATAPERVRRAVRAFGGSDVDVIAETLFNRALCNAGEGVRAVQPVLAPGDPCGTAYAVQSLAEVGQPFVEAVLDGSFEGGASEVLRSGQWASTVPEDVRSEVDRRSAELEEGTNPFVGPLFDNTGTQRLAEGEELTPEEVATQWDWLLGGVIPVEQS